MSIPISGTSLNSLSLIQQELGLNSSTVPSSQVSQLFAQINGLTGTTQSTGITSLLAGIGGMGNTNPNDLMALLSALNGPANLSTIPSGAANPSTFAFQNLFDAMFKTADTNGTGQLDQTQFAGMIAKLDPTGTTGINVKAIFSALDPNNTGFVTKASFDSALTGAAPQANGFAAGSLKFLMDAVFQGANTSGTGQLDQTQFASIVSKMDPNGTSGVSASTLFSALDPNNTGFVSQASFDSALNSMFTSATSAVQNQNPINSALSQISVQTSLLQFQVANTLLSDTLTPSTNPLGSLLNLVI